MITAIGTDIVLDILLPNEDFYAASAAALQDAAAGGSLVHFGTHRECDAFLDSLEIRAQALTREALFLASRTWRINRQQGGKRTRILSHFLIGAHAHKQTTQLLSRDRGFYRRLFPALTLLDPAA